MTDSEETKAPSGLDALKKPSIPAPQTTAPAIPAAEKLNIIDKVPEAVKEYQQYTSARIATCMVTPGGIRINFTNYNYYTKDQRVVEYLDSLIEEGSKALTKGEQLTKDEINPEAAAKRAIIEEFKKSQEGRDFSGQGTAAALAAAGKTGGAGTGQINTDQVAN